MAKTIAWGGLIELNGISDLSSKKIEVLQAEGPPMIIEENLLTSYSSIILIYHRHY